MKTSKDETTHERARASTHEEHHVEPHHERARSHAHEAPQAVEHVHAAVHADDEPKAAHVAHVEHAEAVVATEEHVVEPKAAPHHDEAVHVTPRVPRREEAKAEPEPVGPQQVAPAQVKVGDRLLLPDGNEVTALGVLNTDNELLIQVREGGGWVNATGAALL